VNRYPPVLLAGLFALTACGSSTQTAAVLPGTIPGTPTAAWSRQRLIHATQHLAATSGTPTARTLDKVLRTGAIFASDINGDHFCTASVVSSPKKDMLLTAAHCIHGGKGKSYDKDLIFVPNYQSGATPSGEWAVKSMLVDQRWADSSDPDLDVAFMAVSPLNGRNIEDVLKGNTVGFDQGYDNHVMVVGYPKNAAQPIGCGNRTSKQMDFQMRFACTGYFGGTSGSPWIKAFDPATGTGQVIGVIGGYQEGGDTDQVSYSPYFDDDVKNLYDQEVERS
jgi:V8-like Glu-specific endopeptidase